MEGQVDAFVLDGRTYTIPRDSAAIGACDDPVGAYGRHSLCKRLANNVLFCDGAPQIPGWRRVRCRPRYACIGGAWRPHDLSLQRRRDRRFWGTRHHVRIWIAPDGSHAIGQAHVENWVGTWRRRHRVLGLEQALHSLQAALPGSRIVHVADRQVLLVGSESDADVTLGPYGSLQVEAVA